MNELVPSQLASEKPTFLRIAEYSKAPEKGNSASEGPLYHKDESEIIRHLGKGGNIARVLRDSLIALDIDSDELKEIVEDRLPDSFEIESGGEGTGFHRYYRCPEFEGNQIEFKDGDREIGGLRSGNSYCLIPPSKHDETREEYSVSRDIEIASLPADMVENLVSDIRERTSQHRPAAAAAGVGGDSEIPEIPSEYPEKPASWQTTKKWLSENGFLEKLNETSSSDWSGLEFLIAKCLAEGGFSEEAIKTVLYRLHHSAKWHNRGDDYRKRTVRKAIVAACDDDFVNFGNDDMGTIEVSESRKTESGDGNRTTIGGENMPEFTDKLSVPVLESSEEGDSFKNLVIVEGQDGSDTFEYLSLKKGRVEEATTTDGDTVIVENVTDSVSLGSPEYIDSLIEGLENMKEEIED